MSENNICNICSCKYSGDDKCPECLDRYNQELKKVEAVIFEDDLSIKLRDGKTYKIPPCTLKNARKLMSIIGGIETNIIMFNFLPTEDPIEDEKRMNTLFDILNIAFVNYPEMTKEYMEEYIDIEIARKIIDMLIGLNGLKK